MDKYTVDLDKVLNDFEYNELTIENNQQDHRSVASASIPTYPSGSRLKATGVTKHSINTVFKSLDEYVNSDISSTPTTKPVFDNKSKLISDKSVVAPAESNILVDISSDAARIVTFNSLGSDNSITEGLNLEITSQEDIVFDKKAVLDDGEVDNSDSESTESVYLDMSGGSKNVILNCGEAPNKSIHEEQISKPIGFDNTLDIDDAELSQYLEDLEKELDMPKEDMYEKCADDHAEDVKSSEAGQMERLGRKDSLLDRPNSLDIVNNLVPTRECINLIGQPGSTPYNNAYVSKDFNSPKINELSEDSVTLHAVQPDTDPSTDLHDKIHLDEAITTIEVPTQITLSTPTSTPQIIPNTDGDNISCNSSVSISSSADTASSSAMSPTFSEASTTSIQSTESTDDVPSGINKHKLDSRQKKIVRDDKGYVGDEKEDREHLLSVDEDSKSDEAIVECKVVGGVISRENVEDEEISAMDFIAETSSKTPHQLNQNNNNDSQTLDQTNETIQQQITSTTHSQQQKPCDVNTSESPQTKPSTQQSESSVETNNNLDTVQTSNIDETNKHLISAVLSDESVSTTAISVDSATVSAPPLLASRGGIDEATAEANSWLGREQPIWIPDIEALNCLHCDMKFTVIKRRHHCRACGLVLCSRCCNSKFRLEYLNSREARVCAKCHEILLILYPSVESVAASPTQPSTSSANPPNSNTTVRQPNPNNPMDYCSTVPPPLQQQQQMGGGGTGSGTGTNGANGGGAPTVMVPISVLKRNGSTSGGSKKSSKSVMFCDGIRPGSDLTNLDQDFNYNMTTSSTSGRRSPDAGSNTSSEGTIGSASGDGGSPQSHQLTTLAGTGGVHRIVGRIGGSGGNQPDVDKGTKSFIPASANGLPPRVSVYKSDISYSECSNSPSLIETLKSETVTFAIQKNLHVNVKIVNMSCCINKMAWCFSTDGLMSVGQDEILILLETIENENTIPKDILYHLNDIYLDAVKGQTVAELGVSLHNNSNFLESKSHVGFLYIRPTFQCLLNLILPKESYLIGILIHRWETPWAKVFPLRLVLRLGAEYRYYPSPIISTRHRDSVFVEIGHTIINILADFRNFSYSLPHIRGLSILMEEKKTTIHIPVNRYDQVMKSLNNSSEHILAFGGNFSSQADSHLVCIQNKNGTSENTYTTHAININHKPRKITGASYIVFNGALKSSSGLSAKSSIVEDGLMIQIHPEDMVKVRESLRQMRDHVIRCGPAQTAGGGDNATPRVSSGIEQASDEMVYLKWGDADVCFNIGVKSLIDDTSMSGIPSIRVHQGKDFICNSGNRFIRWTEVFILQNGEENNKSSEPVDVSKVASDIARATCTALVKYLDLLASNNFYKVGIRTNLHVENVSYSAGSNGIKLPPIYMKSLDNELIPVLHRITASNSYASAVVLELVFRILNAGGDSAVPLHLTR